MNLRFFGLSRTKITAGAKLLKLYREYGRGGWDKAGERYIAKSIIKTYQRLKARKV